MTRIASRTLILLPTSSPSQEYFSSRLLVTSDLFMAPPPHFDSVQDRNVFRQPSVLPASVKMQHVHLNSSNSSLSSSSNLTASRDWNQHVDEVSSCLSLDVSFSEKTFLPSIFSCVSWLCPSFIDSKWISLFSDHKI